MCHEGKRKKEAGLKMSYEVRYSKKYRQDLKRVLAGGYDESKLNEAVNILASGSQLPSKYRDHPLKGNRKGARECHIEPDWVLVYRKYEETLILLLMRTGSHSEVLNM